MIDSESEVSQKKPPRNALTAKGVRKRTPPHNIYTFEVSLRYIKPKITRTIQIPGNRTLAKLHDILQDALSWQNYHLHEFHFRDESYGVPSDENWEPVLNEKKYTLDALHPNKGDIIWYTYDFGDDWEHQCKAIKIEGPTPENEAHPICLKASRSVPPEDCGGAPGYGNVLEVLAKPEAERDGEEQELVEWLPPGYDPEKTDIRYINKLLSKR